MKYNRNWRNAVHCEMLFPPVVNFFFSLFLLKLGIHKLKGGTVLTTGRLSLRTFLDLVIFEMCALIFVGENNLVL